MKKSLQFNKMYYLSGAKKNMLHSIPYITNLVKTKYLLSFVLLLSLMFGYKPANASHMMGADITYKCIDTLKWDIYLSYFRDCKGVPIGTPFLTVQCIKPDGTVGKSVTLTASMNKIILQDVTPVCSTEPNRCNNNQGSSGDGVEQHVWKVTIDLRNDPQFANWEKDCSTIRMTSGECCRNGSITTGAANANFFTYAEINIDKAKCNSSPALTSVPIGILCCNQAFSYTIGALDTADYDSISYSWAHPLSAWNQNIGYSGQYLAYNHPFTAFYPGTTQPPLALPNGTKTNPNPIGIYLDSSTGDIILYPYKCGEITVAVIQMVEWRKDPATGKYVKVGTTRRDLQFKVLKCTGNNAPSFTNTTFNHQVCENKELCFDIFSDDRRYIDPATGTLGKLDSVKMSWNGGISGATFKIKDKKARLPEAQFCWTPKLGQAKDIPYTFTVTLRDDACPMNALSVRTFTIRVKPTAQTKRVFEDLGCGRWSVESRLPANFAGSAIHEWNVFDSLGNVIFDRKTVKFESRGGTFSNRQYDTLQFRRGGKYIITLRINNMPTNCPNNYSDTIIVPQMLEADLAIGNDTFICAGTTLKLDPYLKNVTPPIKYQWGTMPVRSNGVYDRAKATQLDNDTFPTKDISVRPSTYDTAFYLTVTDASKCFVYDTIIVAKKNNPNIKFPAIPRLCTYDSTVVLPTYDTAYFYNRYTKETTRQGDTLRKLWYFDGDFTPFSSADSVKIHKRGDYVLQVFDELGCYDIDTFTLLVNDTVIANAGLDYTICFNDKLKLEAGGLDTVANGKSGYYNWYDISDRNNPIDLGRQGNQEYKGVDSAEYNLDLYVTQGGVTCFDNDTLLVHVNALPIISLEDPRDICEKSGDMNMTFYNLIPTVPNPTGFWYHSTQPAWVGDNVFRADSAPVGKHFVSYIYTDPGTGCINKDSVEITVMSRTPLELRERDFCQSVGQVSLQDEVVVIPRNLRIGTQKWECLEGCNDNDFSKILYENRFVGSQEYYIDLSEGVYNIKDPNIDRMKIALEYVNQNGCLSWDTTEIRVWKVPVVIFTANSELCHDHGQVFLNDLTGVNLKDGQWYVYDTIGFRAPTALGAAMGPVIPGTKKRALIFNDTINTLSSVELPNLAARPNQFYLRYEHTATGCFASNDTVLQINPRPIVSITEPTPINRRYCETADPVALAGLPSGVGGAWTSSDPASIVSSTFVPANAVRSQDIKVFYTFTNEKGCKRADSITVRVDPEPVINLPNDTVFCRPQDSSQVSFNISTTVEHANSLVWVTATPQSVSFDPPNGLNPRITINLNNDTTRTYVMFAETQGAQANGSVCPDVNDFFYVTVNPVPDVRIEPNILNACNPLETDFLFTVLNKVDPNTLTYNWDLGNGQTSTDQSPIGLYSVDGTANISLMVTTPAGCDTTVTASVDVYPIPDASFRPNPDNFTTAALPRFKFNNTSTVANVLNSTIVRNQWDFGDLLNPDAISDEQHPTHFYGSDTATYEVTLVVETNYGCMDTFNYFVRVGPDLLVYIPNAFTPDFSGPLDNEGFHAIISGEKAMDLQIFNRWGELMFKTTDKDVKWDGKFKDQPCQQGVYGYQLKVTGLDDELHEYSGTVTLLR